MRNENNDKILRFALNDNGNKEYTSISDYNDKALIGVYHAIILVIPSAAEGSVRAKRNKRQSKK